MGWRNWDLLPCSVLSLLAHLLFLFPMLSHGWRFVTVPPPSRPPALQVTLLPSLAPAALKGLPSGQSLSPVRPAPTVPRPEAGPSVPHRKPQVKVLTRPTPSLPVAPVPEVVSPAYPVHSPGPRPQHPSPQKRVATGIPRGEGGVDFLDPPVLIKGPERIPIPPFLRNRDGHFLLTLRCHVEPDGSTRVWVMEGTGAPDLDDSVRASFSGLPWYRAERAGKPVAVDVRLVIEGRWEAGQDSIDWGGRIPRQSAP